MKVTALIPDDLVKEVSRHAHGENLTGSLVIALREWVALKRLSKLNEKILAKPLRFSSSYSASKVRSLTRKK